MNAGFVVMIGRVLEIITHNQHKKKQICFDIKIVFCQNHQMQRILSPQRSRERKRRLIQTMDLWLLVTVNTSKSYRFEVQIQKK